MTTQPENFRLKGWTRIAIAIAAGSFGLYVLNILIGKANIVYGLKLFHFGSVAEFLILLLASVSFVAVTLYAEKKSKSNPEPDEKEVNQ